MFKGLIASLCYFFKITYLLSFNILFFMFVFSFFLYACFRFLCILCSCFVFAYCFSFYIYGCLFPIFVQVHRQLPSGGNSILLNKYHMGMMEHTKCKTFGYNPPTPAPPHRNDRSDVTADNRAYLDAVRTVHHVLYHHPVTYTVHYTEYTRTRII